MTDDRYLRSFVADKRRFLFDYEATGFIYIGIETMDTYSGEAK